MKKKNVYLKNDDLAAELQKWYDSGDKVETRYISNRLGEMFMMIAKHMLGMPSFKNYHQDVKDDLVSDAVLKMIKNLKNYKPERSSAAFNYFTRCAYCSFMATLTKYYKYVNLKRDLVEHAIDELHIDSE